MDAEVLVDKYVAKIRESPEPFAHYLKELFAEAIAELAVEELRLQCNCQAWPPPCLLPSVELLG